MGETLNQTWANTAHSYLPIIYDRHFFVMPFLPTTKREEKSQPIGHPLYMWNSMSSIWSLESSSSPLHRKWTEKDLCRQNVQYIFMILHSATSHQHFVSLLKGLTSLVLPMFSHVAVASPVSQRIGTGEPRIGPRHCGPLPNKDILPSATGHP